jgi:YedE family putative selenium metabolism protein
MSNRKMIDNREKACYSDSRVTNAGEKARIHAVFDILVPEYRTSANLVRLYRRKENMKKENLFVILTGVVIGIAALVLTALGNPANMGFCIACFERDIAGAVGLHSAAKVQYVRPEIIGLVLGSFLMALASKEWKARAGSSPALRFVLGAFVMIGALAFLGCPLRMVLRLAGGDLNAVVGLAGFAFGIFLGTLFIRKGFTLQRNYATKTLDGTVLPAVMAGLLILFLAVPTLFKLSEEGPGSKHAPFLIALLIALVVGALAQKSRICMVGGLRDTMMFKDLHLLWGFIAIFVTVLIGNLCLHKFNLGFAGQPVAHSDHVWNFLGMLLAGWGSVLLGGCPLRQLILAGSGNADSAVTVFGMIVGAAFAHNFGLAGNAASESSAGGVSTNGRVAVVLGIVIVLVISIVNSMKKQEAQKNG